MTFFMPDEQLNSLAKQILAVTWAEFPELTRDQCALTWLVYDTPVMVDKKEITFPGEFWQHPINGFSYRGDETIYPASVVKLFYLVAIHQWLEAGNLKPSVELNRAMTDMIVDSSNDATSLVVDMLTHTTSGPELPPQELAQWQQKRDEINRYFQGFGWEELKQINVNQKTWCDGYYGREKQFVGEKGENRNRLTTNAVARLFHNMVAERVISPERSQQMMKLLNRQLPPTPADNQEENQITGFLGESLPANAKLWSKAGWTSQVRHDAAYIEIPNLPPFLLVVFTEGQKNSQNKNILPFISQLVLEMFKSR
ncbi:unknown [Crocosphaera subtropica ATCC 51142]|uniref:Beta-lactamase class A catalytic domain-containing protein n=1 Tax=Crocosphaera subtropica (strain ATCC 51142 / BH68) TaxID=43989 RepID=B1WYX1_CROS5|nr:serine hydrolase [Crocosphaera subtropica]ACB52735.1 unknown [Crocosphaera subtropica ATCC 51142]